MQSEEKFHVVGAFDRCFVLHRFVWSSKEMVPDNFIWVGSHERIQEEKVGEKKKTVNSDRSLFVEAFFREWETQLKYL